MRFSHIKIFNLFEFDLEMTVMSSYNYATIKPWGLYVPSCVMLRLMIAYEGLLEILHHNQKI